MRNSIGIRGTALILGVVLVLMLTSVSASAGQRLVDNLRVSVPMDPPAIQQFCFAEGTYLVSIRIDYSSNEGLYGEEYTRFMPVCIGAQGVDKSDGNIYNTRTVNGLGQAQVIVYIRDNSLLEVGYSAGAPLSAVGYLTIERL